MSNRASLKTIRMSERDSELAQRFLDENPAIENFSALARIAILDFISKRGTIRLRPIVTEEPAARPSFLWDYDITEGQVREILAGPLERRAWLVARILERASLDEVWRYLTPAMIERDLPHLRMPARAKEHWAYALKRWREAS